MAHKPIVADHPLVNIQRRFHVGLDVGRYTGFGLGPEDRSVVVPGAKNLSLAITRGQDPVGLR
jgi:hypothetical protein